MSKDGEVKIDGSKTIGVVNESENLSISVQGRKILLLRIVRIVGMELVDFKRVS